mmetsp:Transcript_54161/g.144356  ORF Transcript_54161/g.144356 Transcript_54161/m.144356 type:complete len:116 (+) Transcript_54161:6549-6896(+)
MRVGLAALAAVVACGDDGADEPTTVWSPCSDDTCSEYGEGCESPRVFHVTMCDSWTCKDDGCGPDETCVNYCADIQKSYPSCRCPEWPESRATYYAGLSGQQYEAWKAKHVGESD